MRTRPAGFSRFFLFFYKKSGGGLCRKQLLNVFKVPGHADHDHPLVALYLGVAHSHLPCVVAVDAADDVISKSMQLIAGRIGQ